MKNALITLEKEPVKGCPQFYCFDMGHEPGEFWIHGVVRARSPAKALKKARRIQKAKGWPFMRCDDLPSKRMIDDIEPVFRERYGRKRR